MNTYKFKSEEELSVMEKYKLVILAANLQDIVKVLQSVRPSCDPSATELIESLTCALAQSEKERKQALEDLNRHTGEYRDSLIAENQELRSNLCRLDGLLLSRYKELQEFADQYNLEMVKRILFLATIADDTFSKNEKNKLIIQVMSRLSKSNIVSEKINQIAYWKLEYSNSID